MENSITSYLSFELNNEQFAVNVSRVIEILEIPKITNVPRSPQYLKGVINRRGNVLPVIDTRVKFKMDSTEMTVDTCIIVMEIDVEDETVTVGTLVDSVKEVLEIKGEDIKQSPSIGSQYNPEFIEGVVEVDQRFIMLLNIGKVFSTEDLDVLQSGVIDDKVNQETK